MPQYHVVISETGEQYACKDSQTLLEGMEQLGKKGIPVGCRGGGCGVCKIEIQQGEYVTRPMSRDHVSADDEAAGRVLACRAWPRSDVSLRVLGKMKKALGG